MAKRWGSCFKCGATWKPGHTCAGKQGQTQRDGGLEPGFYAVKVGWTPGVYMSWAAAKAEIDALAEGEAVYKKCSTRAAAVAFVGGDTVVQAWDAFRAGKLDEAEELFRRGGDLGGHGAHRIQLERQRRNEVLREQERAAEAAGIERERVAAVERTQRERARAAAAEQEAVAAIAAKERVVAAAQEQLVEVQRLREKQVAITRKLVLEAQLAEDARKHAEQREAQLEIDSQAAKESVQREQQRAREIRSEIQQLRAEQTAEQRCLALQAMTAKERGQLGFRSDGLTPLDPRARARSGKRGPGRSKRRAARRKREQEIVAREAAAITKEQQATALVAAAEQQAAAQEVCAVQYAVSKVAAIADPPQRKRAERQIDVIKRGLAQIASAADEPSSPLATKSYLSLGIGPCQLRSLLPTHPLPSRIGCYTRTQDRTTPR
eukprot:SAG31_NODE_490_length_14932_cov_9.350300_18_plen_435_part_00